MTDYDKHTGAKQMFQLTKGLHAFRVGDTFIHPSAGKMTVSKVVGFQEGMTFGKQLKVVGLWVVMAVRDGKKRAEKVSFQVPDLTVELGLGAVMPSQGGTGMNAKAEDPHNPNAHVRAGCDHRVGCKVFGDLENPSSQSKEK